MYSNVSDNQMVGIQIPTVPNKIIANKRFARLDDLRYCYRLIQRFRVTGLFAGQYNTKLHGTITDVIYTIVGSALLKD